MVIYPDTADGRRRQRLARDPGFTVAVSGKHSRDERDTSGGFQPANRVQLKWKDRDDCATPLPGTVRPEGFTGFDFPKDNPTTRTRKERVAEWQAGNTLAYNTRRRNRRSDNA